VRSYGKNIHLSHHSFAVNASNALGVPDGKIRCSDDIAVIAGGTKAADESEGGRALDAANVLYFLFDLFQLGCIMVQRGKYSFQCRHGICPGNLTVDALIIQGSAQYEFEEPSRC